MKVLQVENAKKSYFAGGIESTALAGVSFEVEEGEFVGVMGPSGAGKTTLLNLIATIDAVSSGNISIGSQSVCSLREPALSDFRRNMLGFIFQDYNLLDTLTIGENIALPLILSHHGSADITDAVADVASALGIEELLAKYPCQVSGGQRQRAAAARAIVNKPRLVLADEPTGALDSRSAGALMQCLQGLNRDRHSTILLVTHDAYAASYCGRVLFIKDGRLDREKRRDGSQKDLYDAIVEAAAELGGDGRELC